MRAAAILVAAGSGERLGADRPKAFVVLAGRPMYAWSMAALEGLPVVAAVPRGWSVDGALDVPGGASRSESVRNALAAVPADADAIVVHDAARPLVTAGHFERTLAALVDADAATAAARVVDTVKEAGPDGVVRRTLDRSTLWAVQTPQAFRREVLEAALDVPADVLATATDDASLVERRGGRVVVVESGPENLKVTTPHDLRVAGSLLTRR